MKKITLTFLFINFFAFAQVGIGTTNPTAKLEIDASQDAIPALEIVPRTTAPTGTANGQISIIDGSLYIYDLTRAKWLSSETIIFPFGLNGVVATEYLQYARVANQYSGAKVLQNSTIIGISSEASAGNASKSFDITVKTGGTTTIVSTNTFSLNGYTYLNSTANINVSAGDYITVSSNGGADVNNPTVTLYLKWRK